MAKRLVISILICLALPLSAFNKSAAVFICRPPCFPVAKDKNNIVKQAILNDNLKIESKSAIIIESKTGEILWQKDADQKSSIASLTKLMTAIIFIESKTDLNKEVIFTKEDDEKIKEYYSPEDSIGKIYVKPGDKMKVKDLLYSSLVGSANNATMALARSTGLSEEEFVRRMNERAQVLGLKNTFFEEPTGLDKNNVSSASDISHLASYAFKNSLIRRVTTTKKYSFKIINSKKWHTINNTNWLLGSLGGVFGSKTGYLEEAGYCITTGVNNKGKEAIITLLGAKDSNTRFKELKELANWILKR